MLVASFFSMCALAGASAPVAELWNRLSFESPGGDGADIELDGDRISRVIVGLGGTKVEVPSRFFSDLGIAFLQDAVLVRSFGSSGPSIAALQFPVFDPDAPGVRPRDMNVASFVFQNGRLERVDLWKNAEKSEIVWSRTVD